MSCIRQKPGKHLILCFFGEDGEEVTGSVFLAAGRTQRLVLLPPVSSSSCSLSALLLLSVQLCLPFLGKDIGLPATESAYVNHCLQKKTTKKKTHDWFASLEASILIYKLSHTGSHKNWGVLVSNKDKGGDVLFPTWSQRASLDTGWAQSWIILKLWRTWAEDWWFWGRGPSHIGRSSGLELCWLSHRLGTICRFGKQSFWSHQWVSHDNQRNRGCLDLEKT